MNICKRGERGPVTQIPAQAIISYIERNFEFKTRKNGSEYCIPNPLVPDAGKHLNINPQDGTCHDWRGDAQWAGYNSKTGEVNKCTFVRLVQAYRRCSYFQAIKEILGDGCNPKAYLQADREKVVEEADPSIEPVYLPKGSAKLHGTTTKLGIMAGDWLKNVRAYTDEMIEQYDIRYVGLDIVWPYYEYGELVYWQQRSTIDKAFLFPDLPKGLYLYGFDDIEPASYLIITEAIIDANTVGDQCGATGGAVLTVDQVKKIKLLGPKDGIILAPDNDGAGLESVLYNADLLEPLGYRVMYSVPSGGYKDWNEISQKCGRSEARKHLEKNIKNVNLATRVELRQRISDIKSKKYVINV